MELDGAIYIDRIPLKPDDVDREIERHCRPAFYFPGAPNGLYIEAHPDLPYGDVLQVLERCRALGGTRAVFVTRRDITVLEALSMGDIPNPEEWRRQMNEQPLWRH